MSQRNNKYYVKFFGNILHIISKLEDCAMYYDLTGFVCVVSLRHVFDGMINHYLTSSEQYFSYVQ